MTVKITYSNEAVVDIFNITQFLATYLDKEAVYSQLDRIRAEIEKIADLPLLRGIPTPEVGRECYKWLIVNKKYWVFFVKDSQELEVVRVWPTRQRPITPNKIRP